MRRRNITWGSCEIRAEVSQGYKEALYWFAKATNEGLDIAQTTMGFAYEKGQGIVQKDVGALPRWFRKAAGHG